MASMVITVEHSKDLYFKKTVLSIGHTKLITDRWIVEAYGKYSFDNFIFWSNAMFSLSGLQKCTNELKIKLIN